MVLIVKRFAQYQTDNCSKAKIGGFSCMCKVPYAGQTVSLGSENIEYLSPEQITNLSLLRYDEEPL